MREKINHPLYFPTVKIDDRKSLFDVIKDGIAEGVLTAYDKQDDEFKISLTSTEALAELIDSQLVYKEDEFGEATIPVKVPVETDASKVVKYWMKEDWFFDRERSIMDVRILGLAPLVIVNDENGDFKSLKLIFWILKKLSDARSLLLNLRFFVFAVILLMFWILILQFLLFYYQIPLAHILFLLF